jgi:hypothetical protein
MKYYDKYDAALRAAGPLGMTRKQLHEMCGGSLVTLTGILYSRIERGAYKIVPNKVNQEQARLIWIEGVE